MEPANEKNITTRNGEEENDKAVTKEDEYHKEDEEKLSPPSSPPTEQQPPPPPKSVLQKMISFYWEYQFLIHILMAIGAARIYPRLGKDFLAPQITATWIAVILMFCTYLLSCYTVVITDLGVSSLVRPPPCGCVFVFVPFY
jgi:hypothetical protein